MGKSRQVDPLDLEQLAIAPVRFRRVAGLFRPHRWRLLLVVLVIVESSVVALVQPLLIQVIIDRALPQGNRSLLLLCAGGLVAVAATNGVLGIAQAWLATSVGQAVTNDLRTRVFAHLQRQSINVLTRTRGGELRSRVGNDIAGLRSSITTTATRFATNITTLVATMVAMVTLSWQVTLVTAVALSAAVLLTRRVASAHRDVTARKRRELSDLSSLVQGALSIDGAFLTQTLGIAPRRESEFAATSERVVRLDVLSRMAGQGRLAAVNIAVAATAALICLAAGFPELTGSISLGTLVALTILAAAAFRPAVNLLNVGTDRVASLALLSRVLGYLDLQVEVEEPLKPTPLPRQSLRGEVTFEDVSYRYPDTDADVLSHVRFTIPAGGSAAVVGETGSGKSTLGHLLARIADPTSGRVLIDGVDLSEVSSADRTRAIGIVSHRASFFDDTLRTNLLLAKADASDEELWQALETAHVAALIRNLPLGLETVAGEQGCRFSGSEKLRLSIARTLLRDPKVLIVDEAMSDVDNETEQEVLAALSALARGRTTLAIAQRSSAIQDADALDVLTAGQLVEKGAGRRLRTSDGAFSRLAGRAPTVVEVAHSC